MESERLNELATVTAGTSPKGELINSQGLGFPFFQGTKEFGDLFPTAERYTEHPVRVARKGEILIGVRAPVGEVNFATEDSAIGRGVMAVKAKNPEHVNFLFYFLKNLQGKWDSLGSTGSVFENLSASTLREISVPGGLHKKQIGDVLLNIDLKIHANRSLSKTLEGIAQTVFKSWFIDFDPVKAKMVGKKPLGMDDETASLFPDSLMDSELGMIPSGWRVTGLEEVATVKYGAPFASKYFNSVGDGTPLIRIRDLRKQSIATWTTEIHSKGFQVTGGDLLVGMDGEFNPTLWFGEDAWVNQRICKIEPKSFVSNFFTYFKLIPVMRRIEHGSTGSTVIHLGKSDLDSIILSVPTQEISVKFRELLSPLLAELTNLQKQNRVLWEIRERMLPRLVSGELQIPEDMLAS
jgi:type I restriction enzyme S subunit